MAGLGLRISITDKHCIDLCSQSNLLGWEEEGGGAQEGFRWPIALLLGPAVCPCAPACPLSVLSTAEAFHASRVMFANVIKGTRDIRGFP